jgi:outer membrane protein OmpA-like peptidoglycan-associated protein
VRRFACVILLAVAACTASVTSQPQRFIVFFQEWSAAIGPEAEKAITAAAQYAKDHPADAVKVTGYADTTGSAAANVYMSHARAQVVADQLITDGVDQARIAVDAAGATGYALSSQESRRAGIVIGGP